MHPLLVAFGGALGALLRYGVAVWFDRHSGSAFPWPTLVVNLLGCLAMGALWAPFEVKYWEAYRLQAFFMIGLLGAFTTFSAFGLETLDLWRHGHMNLAVIYVLASNVLGFALAAVGFFSVAALLRGPA